MQSHHLILNAIDFPHCYTRDLIQRGQATLETFLHIQPNTEGKDGVWEYNHQFLSRWCSSSINSQPRSLGWAIQGYPHEKPMYTLSTIRPAFNQLFRVFQDIPNQQMHLEKQLGFLLTILPTVAQGQD